MAEEELPITYLPLVDLEIITLPEMELSRVNLDRVEGNVYFTAWLRVVVKMPIMLEGVDMVVGDRENLQPLPIPLSAIPSLIPVSFAELRLSL